jgi:hypothetical protein
VAAGADARTPESPLNQPSSDAQRQCRRRDTHQIDEVVDKHLELRALQTLFCAQQRRADNADGETELGGYSTRHRTRRSGATD